MNLTRNQQIVLGGGLALIISSFLPWYGVLGFSINAWDAEFWAWGGVLAGTAAAVVLAVVVFGGMRFSLGRWGVEEVVLVLAATSVVLILVRLFTESRAVDFGLYLGLASAIVIGYGAFMSWRATGADLNPFAGMSTGQPTPPPAGSFPSPPPASPMATPPPETIAAPPPSPTPQPAALPAPPKPAAPPPQPTFSGYWFYVTDTAPLTSSGGYTVAQLNPGAWYWASAERDGWVETRTDQGAAGWVAATAVHRQV